MGVCSSGSSRSPQPGKQKQNSKERSKKIEIELHNMCLESKKIIRLLLLGTGGGGKSTLLKQMKIIHGSGFDQHEVERNRNSIRGNLVDQMAVLLRAIHSEDIPLSDEVREAASQFWKALKPIETTSGAEPETVFDAICMIWADPSVKTMVLERGLHFQMNESSPYFFDNIDRILAEDYVPTQQDILLNRTPTLGIVQINISMKEKDFLVIDVGGQRSQRRKWIHCFDNVCAVIYVSAMSEFDQQMEEDEETNRLTESLNLFESICNSPFFVHASMVLFLNKKDLFLEKIQAGKTIRTVFPNYFGPTGPESYESQANYLTAKFLDRRKDRSQIIYAHHVCATDTNQVEIILDSALDTIIRKVMEGQGLM